MADSAFPAVGRDASPARQAGAGARRSNRLGARRYRPSHTRNARHVWVWYAAGVAAYGALFSVWQLSPDPAPLSVRMASVLLAAICLYPTALWYAGGKRGLPMFEMICASYGVQYSLPVYLQPNRVPAYGSAVELPWAETLAALLLASLGMASMIAAYYALTRSERARRCVSTLDLTLSNQQLFRYLVLASLAGTGTSLASALHLAPAAGGPLGFVVRFLTFQSTVGLALLAQRVYRRRRAEVRWRYTLYTWLGVTVGVGLTTGMLEGVLVPMGVVFLVRWHLTGKTPWRAAVLVMLLFFMLQSVKQEYRMQTWQAVSAPTLTERATLWFSDGIDLVESISSGDIGENARSVLSTSSSRLDLLHTLALVHALTPSQVPYLHGKTYAYLAYSWVPRILWRDKPQTQDATDELALRYGLLMPDQQGTTSVGAGHLAEAYANLGTPGIIVVMAAQGALFGFLNLMLNGPDSEGGAAVYLAQMIWFLNGIGTSAAIILGSMVQSMAPSLATLAVFGKLGRRHVSDRTARVAGSRPGMSVQLGGDRAEAKASRSSDHSRAACAPIDGDREAQTPSTQRTRRGSFPH